jgi:hypothetical protein
VGKLDDKLIILLNTDAILTMEEMNALSTIDRATADAPSTGASV